jgi:hypothetical protein
VARPAKEAMTLTGPHCGIGFGGGQCLSLGDYVRETGLHGRGERCRRVLMLAILCRSRSTRHCPRRQSPRGVRIRHPPLHRGAPCTRGGPDCPGHAASPDAGPRPADRSTGMARVVQPARAQESARFILNRRACLVALANGLCRRTACRRGAAAEAAVPFGPAAA